MPKKVSWRGLNELVDAKEKAKEVELKIENLLKEQRALDGKDIKNHVDKFSTELDDAIFEIKEKQKEILRDLEEHKKKLLAKERFFRRHYKRY